MERHLSTRMTATGYSGAIAAFIVSAFFLVDVFGEYFVNTSYFFSISLWYEFAIAAVAAAVGIILAALTYRRR